MLLLLLLLLSTLAGWPEPRESNKALHISLNLPDVLGLYTRAPADCTGHVVPGARPCALGTFSYLVTSRSYFCLSYPNRFL